MKIAVITNHVPSYWAHSINTMKMAEGFFRLGHHVEVLVVYRAEEEFNKLKINDVNQFYCLNKKVKIKYFRDYSLYYFRDIGAPGYLIRKLTDFLVKIIPKLATRIDPEKKISKYCKQNKFDLAFCRTTFHAVYYNILNKVPTILDIHGYQIPELNYIIKLKKSIYFKGIITLNEFLKQKLVKIGFQPEKIVFMENAVDLNRFDRITDNKKKLRKKLNLPLEKIIILYSGIISHDRGIDTVLKASKLLKNEDLSFYFLGTGEKFNSIRKWTKFIKRNKIKSNIKFLGFKPQVFIPFYLKAADILLATYSAHSVLRNYTSPVKLIEYMASKTPVIITEIGRLKNLCSKDECLFTKVDEPEDLMKKIEMLITHFEIKNKIIKNAYNRAKRFILEKRCQKILELLK